MLHPYRRANRASGDEQGVAARWDDRVLAALMIALGAPRVVLALASHEHFGAEATLAAIAACLGLLHPGHEVAMLDLIYLGLALLLFAVTLGMIRMFSRL